MFWAQPDASARQWQFCAESLAELREACRTRSALAIRTGDALAVLKALQRQRGIAQLWSHQETGNDFTYRRDRAVARWCREKGIPWHQPRSFGVIRALSNRDGWAPAWELLMRQPVCADPAPLPALDGIELGGIPSADDLKLANDPCPGRQRGGRSQGVALLDSFLQQRGRRYARSFPVHSPLLSPAHAFQPISPLAPCRCAKSCKRRGYAKGPKPYRTVALALPLHPEAGEPALIGVSKCASRLRRFARQ